MKSWQWYEHGKPPIHPSKEGESLPGCPIAGVLATLMKNYKNGLPNFLISIILKIEQHGFFCILFSIYLRTDLLEQIFKFWYGIFFNNENLEKS